MGHIDKLSTSTWFTLLYYGQGNACYLHVIHVVLWTRQCLLPSCDSPCCTMDRAMLATFMWFTLLYYGKGNACHIHVIQVALLWTMQCLLSSCNSSCCTLDKAMLATFTWFFSNEWVIMIRLTRELTTKTLTNYRAKVQCSQLNGLDFTSFPEVRPLWHSSQVPRQWLDSQFSPRLYRTAMSHFKCLQS